MPFKPKVDKNLDYFESGTAGSGDVTGPASAVDSNFASFNGTSGKVIKDSGVGPTSQFSPTAHDHTTADGSGVLTNDEHDGFSEFSEIATPSTPASSKSRIYPRARSGRTIWVYLTDTGHEIEVGNETYIGRNETGSPMTKGQPVYFTGGVSSGTGLIDLADADSIATMPCLGMLMEDIPSGSNGRIMASGLLFGVNTVGLSAGRAFVSQTAGSLTSTEPSHPALRQRVGYVITVGASGIFLVSTTAVRGDHEGTISNSWKVGDASAGAKSIQFVADGANIGTLQITPTGARTITIQDKDHTIADNADLTSHTGAAAPHTGHVQIGGQLGGTAASPDIRGMRETGGPTLLTLGAVTDGQYLQRSGSTIIGNTPPGGSGGLTLTNIEVNLGTEPRKSGKFSITTTGLTAGKDVLIVQGNGPYTGKGTRVDEAEMDGVICKGKTTSTTNIDCLWNSVTSVKGNVKFAYAQG